MSTKIEWTEQTWNPVRGCSRVSKGCENCYAERQALRMAGRGQPYAGLVRKVNGHPVWTGAIRLAVDKLDEPLRWRKPRRVFVNSMSDLFHERVPDRYIAACFGIMSMARTHTFQILTKRPERALEWFQWIRNDCDGPGVGCELHAREYCGIKIIGRESMGPVPWPLPNVWLGVSVENQETADERIPLLIKTPARIRFISYEPALGPVNLPRVDFHCDLCGGTGILARWPKGKCHECGGRGSIPAISTDPKFGTPATPARRIHWVIVGGESGPGARAFDIAWARSAIKQCRGAKTAVFIKQLGSAPKNWCVARLWSDDEPYDDDFCDIYEASEGGHCGDRCVALTSSKGGDPAEWPEDLRVREYPSTLYEEETQR